MKKKCFKIAIFLSLFVLLFNFQVAFADEDENGGGGMAGLLETAGSSAGYEAQEVGETTFSEMIGQIIAIALNFLGVIFLILLLYGGFLWMTASGNDDQVKRSKTLIRNAIIGLAIILTARIIVQFILTKAFQEVLQ